MANYKPLENFSNLYNRAYAMFNNTYTPQSASTLKDALSRSMRPAYDKQIAARQDAAKANRAAIDTDAASRGMGSSSWVTDVKNRQNNAAASDIANIESDYQANLYNSLLNRLGQQDEMAMAAAQSAQGNALGLANQLYGKVFAKKSGGGGGGWGGRSRTPEEPPNDPPWDPILDNASNNLRAVAARKQQVQQNAQNASNARAASAARRSIVAASNNLNKKVKNRLSGQPVNRM